MTGGRRPDVKLSVKPKDGSGKRSYVLAGWKGQRGYNVKLEAGWKLIDPDGNEVSTETHWFDLYGNRPREDEQRSSSEQKPAASTFGDDDLPFSPHEEW